ncbi:MAG: hypothetical protein M0Z40_05195 [Actinomycetota bacterium]|nr:hypothetical protein [Actinomycetota bacterium]
MSGEPLVIDQSKPRASRADDAGPSRWRVAVLYGQDEAVCAAGGLIDQLRAARCMAIPVPVPISDPFVDHYDEWQGRALRGAYDFALLAGPLTPPAMAFAVLADTPIARVAPTEPLPINVIESATACGHIDEIPVAEITIDGIRRVFAGVARVTTDDPASIACRLTPIGTRQAFHGCDIRAGTTMTASLPLEVRIDGAGPIGSECVELTGEPGSFVVDLDARPRRPTLVRIRVAPQPLKVVRTDRYP